jgi:ankyrin repeat protein
MPDFENPIIMFNRFNPFKKSVKHYHDYFRLCLPTTADAVDRGVIIHTFDSYAAYHAFVQWIKTLATFNEPAYFDGDALSVSVDRRLFDLIWGKHSFSKLAADEDILTLRNALRENTDNSNANYVAPYKKMHRLDQKRILFGDKSHLLFNAAKQANIAVLVNLLQAFEQKVLNPAVSLVVNGKTVLDTAAESQTEEGFTAILEAVSPDAINAAFAAQGYHSTSALHVLAEKDHSSALLALIRVCTPKTIANSADVTNGIDYDLLELLFMHHDAHTIAKYIQRLGEADGAALKNTFTRSLDQIIHAMVLNASWQSKTFFDLFYDTLGETFVIKLWLKIQESQHNSAWVISLLKKNAQLSALIDLPLATLQLKIKAPAKPDEAEEEKQAATASSTSNSIKATTGKSNKVVTSLNRHMDLSDAALGDIIWQEGFSNFLEFQKIYPLLEFHPALAEKVRILQEKKKLYTGAGMLYATYQRYSENQFSLHHAIHHLSESDFIHLCALFSQQILNAKIREVHAADNSTNMQVAAAHLSGKAFSALMAAVSMPVFSQTMVAVDDYGKNTLHVAAKCFSADRLAEFMARAAMIEPQAYSDALLQLDHGLATPLHLAAAHQDDEAFVSFIQKVPIATLNTALSCQDHQRNTLLHIVVANKNGDSLQDLIDKVDSDALNEAAIVVNNDGFSLLELALMHQSPDMVSSLLDKLDDFTIQFVLTRDAAKSQVLQKIVDSLLHSPSWLLLSDKIFSAIGKFIIPLLCQHWLNGNELPAALMKSIAEYAPDGGLDESHAYNLMLPELHNPWRKLGIKDPAEVKVDEQYIVTGKKTKLRLDDPNFVLTLWREGVLNVTQLRQLRKTGEMMPQVMSTLDRLHQAGRIFSGCYQDLLPDNDSPIGLPEVLQQIVANNSIAQMIRPDEWDETLKQLGDYRYRPKTELHAKEATHEYDHFRDEVVRYVAPDEKAEPTHTDSFRVSFLGNGLNTNLTQVEEKGLPKVGIFYDKSRCVCTGLMTHAVAFADADWAGSLEQVTAYAEKVRPVSQSHFSGLAGAIKKHPYKTNVMIANLATDAAFSIYIADDSSQSRALARKIAADFKVKFDRVLPIVFYHSAISQVRLYLPEEMAADVLMDEDRVKVNVLAEREAKVRLLALKADILAKPEWCTYGLFGKRASDQRATNADELVKCIEEVEKNPPMFWTGASAGIAKKLKETIANRGYGRVDETQDFYVGLQRKYF